MPLLQNQTPTVQSRLNGGVSPGAIRVGSKTPAEFKLELDGKTISKQARNRTPAQLAAIATIAGDGPVSNLSKAQRPRLWGTNLATLRKAGRLDDDTLVAVANGERKLELGLDRLKRQLKRLGVDAVLSILCSIEQEGRK